MSKFLKKIREQKHTKHITVETMVKKYIARLGGDGLCNPEADCTGCKIDNLFACEYAHDDCVVGRMGYPPRKDGVLYLVPIKFEKD